MGATLNVSHNQATCRAIVSKTRLYPLTPRFRRRGRTMKRPFQAAVAAAILFAATPASSTTRMLKEAPASWKDYFFPEIQGENGS